MFFVWRGLVERGELGRVSRTEYDEPVLLEAFTDMAWEDHRPGVAWWVDREYQQNQPHLAREPDEAA